MKHDINNTPLVPYLIAERALWNVIEADKNFNGLQPMEVKEIVDKHTPTLVVKAETIYQQSEHFRKQLNDRRKDCRYVLEMFMEHWSKAILNLKN